LMPSVQIGYMTGAKLNTRKLYERVLESYDITNTEQWFQPEPPPGQQQPPGQPGQPPGMGTPPSPENQQAPQGVTNPSLAAGPQAVSNGNSMAPASMMQQSLAAQTGGPQNV